MSDAWKTFRDFVERTEDLPVGFLVKGACARGHDRRGPSGLRGPVPEPGVEGGDPRVPADVADQSGDAGSRGGKRTLEALRTDEAPEAPLWADSDPIIPFKVGERFAAAINADPPEKIENASHFLQEDAGEQIGERIAAWLAS